MGRANLELEAANLDALIAEDLDLLARGDVDAARILRLCRRRRQRATASLLLHLDVDAFQEGLRKAGVTYLHLLRHRRLLPDLDPYHLARSAGFPYLDALASNDRLLAAEIAEGGTVEWTRDMEDEDDFAYYEVLCAMGGPRRDPSGTERALARFEAALRGAASTRLETLRAVQSKDGGAFDRALGRLLEEWEAAADDARSAGVADPYFANIEAYVCVEGLALVQLARSWGLATEDGYPFLPGPALDLPTPGERPDHW